MKTYFISGHLTTTDDEFDEYYVPEIEQALKEGDAFVVGDARGTDQMAQSFLKDKTDNVIVYHMFEMPRCNSGFKTVGGFKTDTERDEAMTKASDADIAWVRPGREKSGTAKNLNRRIEK